MNNLKMYDVAIVGSWHLAFVTAACLAELGYNTALINPQIEGDDPWTNFPVAPIFEPNLESLINRNIDRNLLNYENGINSNWTAKYIWLAVDTPLNKDDEPVLVHIVSLIEQISIFKSEIEGLIVSSQVPIGFCRQIENSLFGPIAYIPENLRLGEGIDTFLHAERIVIGTSSIQFGIDIQLFLKALKTEFICCNIETAEMIKHASNAFLATSISFANELARIGESLGVNPYLVAKALKLDSRIGKRAYLIPGLGFSGGTLNRDLSILKQTGRKLNIPTKIIDAVIEVNQSVIPILVRLVLDDLNRNSHDGPILIMGYTYKAMTNTLRRSPSVELAKILVLNGVECLGYDPFINENDISQVEGIITHVEDFSKMNKRPAVIVLMTPRIEFLKLDWRSVSLFCQNNSLIIDTHKMLSADLCAEFRLKHLWLNDQNESVWE